MRKVAGLICGVIISLAPLSGFSQQPAGAMIQEIHRRSNPAHPRYQRGVPAQPQPVWESRFGAVAIDPSGGSIGIAEDEPSLRAARRVALRECGVRGCKIFGTVGNGCLVGVYGGGVTAVYGAENVEIATEQAMAACSNKNGGIPCERKYFHCSLPVRVR